uniref:Uncharacterized protein n=1 Tax=Leptocylindrus danicus TaxID=163516 RepID=A0A6U2NLT8_9STRA|mmetsp:Transcript_22159/g.33268  ORF Transcript_22159/g.33268 Transcript_22159/m.33268 type:complete len:410 (+) Transcript_22159:691-1920(+)
MISSFTAAGYGDLCVLKNRLNKAAGKRNDSSSSYFMDSDGYTLLHYAAQHNQIAATRYILGFCFNDEIRLVLRYSSKNYGGCGATPLHRAAFAGSVGAMCVLLDAASKSAKNECVHDFNLDEESRRNDLHALLVAKDISFGDGMTALHKAVSGGRYMAVKILLDYCSDKYGDEFLLPNVLVTKDSEGRTPLELANQKIEDDGSPDDLSRWDANAGGKADWARCKLLLEYAEKRNKTTLQSGANIPSPLFACRTLDDHDSQEKRSATCFRSLPKHLMEYKSCLDCGVENGICRTKAWEDAFRLALSSSIEGKVLQDIPNLDKQRTEIPSQSRPTNAAHVVGSSSPLINGNNINEDTLSVKSEIQHKKKTGMGRPCSSCKVLKLVLVRSSDGKLVCQACKSLKKKASSWLK